MKEQSPSSRVFSVQKLNVHWAATMDKTCVERAFHLANSGDVESVDQIRNMLVAEGFALGPLDGGKILDLLKATIAQAAAKQRVKDKAL